MKKVVTATDFKARSLALISEVEKDGEPITITRRGRPVAVLTGCQRRSGNPRRAPGRAE